MDAGRFSVSRRDTPRTAKNASNSAKSRYSLTVTSEIVTHDLIVFQGVRTIVERYPLDKVRIASQPQFILALHHCRLKMPTIACSRISSDIESCLSHGRSPPTNPLPRFDFVDRL